jgi:hypothetical protein
MGPDVWMLLKRSCGARSGGQRLLDLAVVAYERAHKNRAGVLKSAERETAKV